MLATYLSSEGGVGFSLRNEAEGQFGTGKRIYRANDIRAKFPETSDCWNAMCNFVRNVPFPDSL